jgi:serine/threonine protein kinase
MGLQGLAGQGENARVWHIGRDEVVRICDTADLELARLPSHQNLLETGRPAANGEGLAQVLPLCAGGSIAEAVAARGQLACDETLVIVDVVAAALTELHESGLVHLDVKPANILLTADGQPILGDTYQVTSADGRAIIRGTPPFTIPGMMAAPTTDWIALGRTAAAIATTSASTPIELLPTRLREIISSLLDGRDPRPLLNELQIASTIAVPTDRTPVPKPNRPTIEFGPQPRRSKEHAPRRRAALPLAVVLIFVLVVLLSGAGGQSSTTGPPAKVSWSKARGELTIATPDGPVGFALGQPGDEIAFGDWNCDGTATPAVIRGEDAFVFTSWPGDGPVRSLATLTSSLSYQCD